MLILVTHANHLYTDRKQVKKMQPYPPLQALLVAAALREKGYQVALADTTFDSDIESRLDDIRPDLVFVCEDNFNFLTKMCTQENRDFALRIAHAARARNIRSAVNSTDASASPAVYADAFDQVMIGEPERVDLRNNAKLIRTPAVSDLDALPAPAWDLLDPSPYRDSWQQAHGYFALNLAASRGCPYQCNWCAKPIHGDRYRSQSPARTAAEIQRLREQFSPDLVWFADDIFGLSSRWLAEFAERIERPVRFKIQYRADLVTASTAGALARAGCVEVWMGAESGSQQILDAMDKGLRVESIATACQLLREHGIRPCLFLQFGYPGEEWNDIQRTVEMVRAIRPHDIGVSVSYPMQGTRFHQIVARQMNGASQWRDSADLAMLYKSAYSNNFYRALADALHAEVRGGDAHQAWQKVEELRCVSC